MLNIFGTPISARVPSSITRLAGLDDSLNTTVQPSTSQKEKKENVVVINNGIDEKGKNKVKKPRVPRKKAPAGAIPTEKQKYYQYLTYTAPNNNKQTNKQTNKAPRRLATEGSHGVATE